MRLPRVIECRMGWGMAMKRNFLVWWWLCLAPVMADAGWSILRSADGNSRLEARPVGLEDGKIVFERKGGKLFKAGADQFSDEDGRRLEAWVAAMEKDLHREVVETVAAAKGPRILFIGNSYSFQIPKEFKKLAESEGKKLTVEQVTVGGCTLQRHAANAKTMEKIAKGRWDVVVLQEQSLVPAILEGQRHQMMDPAAKKLVEAVRRAGAVPVFFLTWGRRDGDKMNAQVFPDDTFEAMHGRLVEGYRKASVFAGGEKGGVYTVPVGEVWKVVRQLGKDEDLYTQDGSHPGRRGVYLASCVFFSALFDAPVGRASSLDQGGVLAKAAREARPQAIPFPVDAE